jgi:spore germination cell wall hydrolase CwlJ-like protein
VRPNGRGVARRFGGDFGLFWRRFTVRQIQGAGVLALLVLAAAGLAAHAASLAGRMPNWAVPADAVPAHGYEAEEHFPGAAAIYATEAPAPARELASIATPGAGTTGTIELPDVPVPAMANGLADGTVHPALPFSFRHAASIDRARALECLTTAIYYEAANEPDDGQRAVAQVILNRVRHPAFPATVCGVVYQGSEKSGCQFSFACDNALTRTPMPAVWARASRVANAALAGYVFAPVGEATHYHTYAVTPAWNRKLVMTAAIGAHFFHRWAGWWGTPDAFNRTYAGGEPLPGPHPKIDPMASVAALVAAAATGPVPPMPVTVAAKPAAAAGQSHQAEPAPASEPALPESTILDKWKDTGRPLR